ncbi:hypothetical protein NW768_011637 [Fusarium equiseti]|uniref:Uncharacterized protein n=1 Tax=Fusarium equiseti TaxID=61235 RepID=A0ABQ8QWW1_FUSEQ|nr:hypothetical protein NW768_011637 [Fusarium equiseti]
MCYYDSASGDYSNANRWADPRNTRVYNLVSNENQSTVQLDEKASIPDTQVDSEEPVGKKRKRKDVDHQACGPSTGTHGMASSGLEKVAHDNNNSAASAQDDAKRPRLGNHFPQHDTRSQDDPVNTSATVNTSPNPNADRTDASSRSFPTERY